VPIRPGAATAGFAFDPQRDVEGIGPVRHAVAASSGRDGHREVLAFQRTTERNAVASREPRHRDRGAGGIFGRGVDEAVAPDFPAPERLRPRKVQGFIQRNSGKRFGRTAVAGEIGFARTAARAAGGNRKRQEDRRSG